MAMTPTEIADAARSLTPTSPVTPRLASDGQKLLWFKAAARKRQDRNYVPRMDITGSWV